MDEKEKGKPLGEPDNIKKGNTRPDEAGSEGGLGFLGDQRAKKEGHGPSEEGPRNNPPVDGTLTGEDVKGDTDTKKPGASALDRMWDGPRLNMEMRKREPMITW